MNGACVFVPLYVLHEGIIVGVKEGAQRIREVKKCGVFIRTLLVVVWYKSDYKTILKEIESGQLGTSLPQPLGVVLVPRGVR